MLEGAHLFDALHVAFYNRCEKGIDSLLKIHERISVIKDGRAYSIAVDRFEKGARFNVRRGLGFEEIAFALENELFESRDVAADQPSLEFHS